MKKPIAYSSIVLLLAWAALLRAQCPLGNIVTVTNNAPNNVTGSFFWALDCLDNAGSSLTTVRFDIDGATEIQPNAANVLTVNKAAATIEGANLGSGGPIVLDGGSVAGASPNGLILSQPDITVQDLIVQNFTSSSSGTGILISRNGAKVLSNTTTGNRIGIATTSVVSTFTISGNTVNNNGNSNSTGGISIAGNPTAGVITNNEISQNTGNGILVLGGVVLISDNSIFCNTNSGISRPDPPLPPNITLANTSVVRGTAEAGRSIEVFLHSTLGCAGAPVQGKTFLGSTTTPANGNWSLSLSSGSVGPGDKVTATSTQNGNNTSVFAPEATVSDCSSFTAGISQTNISCAGADNGMATATPNNPSFSYSWSTGDNVAVISNLAPDTYTVTVTDAAGCTDTETATITEPPALSLGVSSTDVFCFGGNNGTANATAGGGTPAYSFLWSNGLSSGNISGLTAGTYTVTLTDLNNCTATQTATIGQPAALSISVSTTAVSCFGGSNGTANSMPTGGTPAYNYAWNNGQTSSNITGLIAGLYTVTITDLNGCTNRAEATVAQPSSALTLALSTNDNACFGGNIGTASANPVGGTPSYTYIWSNGQSSMLAINLTAGTYTVTTTDLNGCTISQSATVGQPAPITLNLSSSNASSGNNNGSASTNPSGGTAPFTYLWNTGATSNQIGNLAAGTYNVTVTDVKGCTSAGSVNVGSGPGGSGACMALPVYALLAPSQVCGNAPFFLEADDLYPNAAVNYVWFLPNGDSARTSLPTLELTASSSAFSGEYFVLRDSAGCRSIAVGGAIISVLTLDNLSAGNDQTLCNAGIVNLTANIPSSGTGAWQSLGAATIDDPAQNNTSARNLQIGHNVFVWAVSLGNCPQAAADTVDIFLEQQPTVRDDHYTLQRALDEAVMEILLNDALAGIADTQLLQISAPSTGQLELLADTRRFRYTVDEDFRGTVSFQYAICSPNSACNLPCDTATVTIEVQNLPNVPTGLVVQDPGLNGALTIRGINGFSRVEITITNRWGDLVFRETDYDNSQPWVGDFKRTGQYLPGGAYYYFLKAFDGDRLVGGVMSGVIHLFEK